MKYNSAEEVGGNSHGAEKLNSVHNAELCYFFVKTIEKGSFNDSKKKEKKIHGTIFFVLRLTHIAIQLLNVDVHKVE